MQPGTYDKSDVDVLTNCLARGDVLTKLGGYTFGDIS